MYIDFQVFTSIEAAAERERRKHHLIAEFEEKVRRYDEDQKEMLQKELEKMRNDVLLEAHRRLKRIEKNSVQVYMFIPVYTCGRYYSTSTLFEP